MSEQRYDNRDGVIWYDGEFLPWRQANIHLLTHSLHYGAAVFEGERAYDGHIFKSEEHTKRLINSAEMVGYHIPFSFDEIEAAKSEALKKSGLDNAYIRALAWRGSEMMGVSAQNNTIHLAIAVWHWGNYFADRAKGIRMTMAKWRRPAPETAPCHSKTSGLYMICTMSKHSAEAEGYADALMLDWRGQIAETTGANIFLIRDGVLHTPTPDCFLDGITRRTVMELARKRGFEVVERVIMPDELGHFSECFITGTAAEITPVAEIAEHQYTPGVITQTLIADFEDLVYRRAKAA